MKDFLLLLNLNLGLMRQTLRIVAIVVVFLMALGIADKAICPNAEASYGLKDAVGTIGISTGIGTVIGLSTIAFYESPTAHMRNILIGAGAGLIAGLGVAAYLFATSPESEDINPEELLVPETKPSDSVQKPEKDLVKPEKKDRQSMFLPKGKSISQSFASVPATFAPRPLLKEWVVAFQVLELRF